jgi:UDP-N-acetylmuramoyl-tripeptide--D-alanyl-D-alanine ligase
MEAVAKSELYSATAAAAVADMLGADTPSIKEGISKIKPVSGRMQRLNGSKDSLLLDESYNASPKAVMAALDSLYQMEAPQKIAVLGNMNELGQLSQQAHIDIGEYCEPKQLDLVVTIGPDANKYSAPAAQARGCRVIACKDPYEAGKAVKKALKPKAVVLVKGSQNNVYAEETVKLLLADPGDAQLLVRQSREWMQKKAKNFS